MWNPLSKASEPKATSDPPSVTLSDGQDPLPESNWIPRRFFSFTALYILLGIKAYEVHLARHHWETDALIFTIIVCYLIAPSAEQATKMMAQARMAIAGVKFRTQQTTTADRSGVTTENKTEVSNDQPSTIREDTIPSIGPIGDGPESDRRGEAIAPFSPADLPNPIVPNATFPKQPPPI